MKRSGVRQLVSQSVLYSIFTLSTISKKIQTQQTGRPFYATLPICDVSKCFQERRDAKVVAVVPHTCGLALDEVVLVFFIMTCFCIVTSWFKEKSAKSHLLDKISFNCLIYTNVYI